MLVKICCIKSVNEAALALDHGADALGLVSEMPSGPGIIDEDSIASIANFVENQAKSVLLTSLARADEIAEQATRCRVNAVQLCTWLDREARRELRALLPGHFLMQVIHVTGPEALARAEDGSDSVDALLLDSGTLAGPTIELGGTGRTHDWNLSREICQRTEVSVFLAGGLNSDNVAAAIDTVRPAGVDICSGVRTSGSLDPVKLKAFVAATGR